MEGPLGCAYDEGFIVMKSCSFQRFGNIFEPIPILNFPQDLKIRIAKDPNEGASKRTTSINFIKRGPSSLNIKI